jgi:NitT/TauT family transport system substrate-binding protein
VTLAAAFGRKLFPPEEVKPITELVRRDRPFHNATISGNAVACLNRFARDVGLLEGDPPCAW